MQERRYQAGSDMALLREGLQLTGNEDETAVQPESMDGASSM